MIVAIIIAFVLLSARVSRVRHSPTVQEAFWTVNGQRVTTASLGAEVTAHVTIRATEEYVGSIVVKVRKDLSFWPDSNYHIATLPVNLVGGQEREIRLTYVPDQASGGGLRGYFIEVDFEVTGTDWVMESSYPPRLKVTA